MWSTAMCASSPTSTARKYARHSSSDGRLTNTRCVKNVCSTAYERARRAAAMFAPMTSKYSLSVRKKNSAGACVNRFLK